MKEYLVMLLVFMGTILLFYLFVGALFIAWIIIGCAALYNKGVNLANEGVVSYLFYMAWPFYLLNRG